MFVNVSQDRPPGPWTRWLETGLPAGGVAIGIVLILVPFLATLVRSLLFWDDAGPSPSLHNFAVLFGDPHFYQALGNTVLAGAGAEVARCAPGLGPAPTERPTAPAR